MVYLKKVFGPKAKSKTREGDREGAGVAVVGRMAREALTRVLQRQCLSKCLKVKE